MKGFHTWIVYSWRSFSFFSWYLSAERIIKSLIAGRGGYENLKFLPGQQWGQFFLLNLLQLIILECLLDLQIEGTFSITFSITKLLGIGEIIWRTKFHSSFYIGLTVWTVKEWAKIEHSISYDFILNGRWRWPKWEKIQDISKQFSIQSETTSIQSKANLGLGTWTTCCYLQHGELQSVECLADLVSGGVSSSPH